MCCVHFTSNKFTDPFEPIPDCQFRMPNAWRVPLSNEEKKYSNPILPCIASMQKTNRVCPRRWPVANSAYLIPSSWHVFFSSSLIHTITNSFICLSIHSIRPLCTPHRRADTPTHSLLAYLALILIFNFGCLCLFGCCWVFIQPNTSTSYNVDSTLAHWPMPINSIYKTNKRAARTNSDKLLLFLLPLVLSLTLCGCRKYNY